MNHPIATEPLRRVVDVLAYDSERRAVLLVEVKGTVATGEAVEQLRRYLQAANTCIPFAMLVDPSRIQIFRWDGQQLSGPIQTFETPEILGHYSERFGTRRVSEDYLRGLVDLWLQDLAFHWKSPSPPGSSELAADGLGTRLAGGTTEMEVAIGGPPVP
jgi:hypothetical protein